MKEVWLLQSILLIIIQKRNIFLQVIVDTTTLTVTVQTSSTDTTTEVYNLAKDISTVTSTDKVYFLQENEDGRFEVYFGDNVIGS